MTRVIAIQLLLKMRICQVNVQQFVHLFFGHVLSDGRIFSATEAREAFLGEPHSERIITCHKDINPEIKLLVPNCKWLIYEPTNHMWVVHLSIFKPLNRVEIIHQIDPFALAPVSRLDDPDKILVLFEFFDENVIFGGQLVGHWDDVHVNQVALVVFRSYGISSFFHVLFELFYVFGKFVFFG